MWAMCRVAFVGKRPNESKGHSPSAISAIDPSTILSTQARTRVLAQPWSVKNKKHNVIFVFIHASRLLTATVKHARSTKAILLDTQWRRPAARMLCYEALIIFLPNDHLMMETYYEENWCKYFYENKYGEQSLQNCKQCWHSVLYREKSFGEAWEGSDDNLQKPSAQWKRVPRCPGCFEFNKNDNEW